MNQLPQMLKNIIQVLKNIIQKLILFIHVFCLGFTFFFQWDTIYPCLAVSVYSSLEGSWIQVFGTWISQWKLKDCGAKFSAVDLILQIVAFTFAINPTSKIAYTAN